MNNNYIKLIALFMLFYTSITTEVKAGAPNWNVNPSSFQYNMTMIALANINCTDLANPSNIIGVFLGTECRGVAYTNQVINGKYLASLFIYSNNIDGDTLSFKVYNKVTDSVYQISTTIQFQQNSAYGTSAAPFIVFNANAPSDVNISYSKVREHSAFNSVVANIFVPNSNTEQYTYTLTTGDGDNDNVKFGVVNNQLVVKGDIDFNIQSSCLIRLRVAKNENCFFEKQFVIQIVNQKVLIANNCITPNHDGINDFFEIDDIEFYKDYSLVIYNNFGIEVYKVTNNYRNNWDGNVNGEALKTGAYYYVLEKQGSDINYKGVLNIVNQN